MSTLKWTGLAMLVATAMPLAVAGAQPPGEIAVDCDKGGNLQRAVDTLGHRGGGTVRITGTCEGVHVDSPYIEIVGTSPATSRIDAGSGTAVSTTEPGHLDIRNVHLAGGQGVHAVGHQRVVFISDCEVSAGVMAVRADTGAGVLIVDSDLTGTQFAIRSEKGIVVAERSSLHDSNFGARVFDARLALIDVEVTASGILGVQALDRSFVSIQGGRFSDNGSAHLGATTGSRLEVFNTKIGGPDDPTIIGLQANEGTKIGLYANDPSFEFWRSANVHNDSYVVIDGVVFHGTIALRSFSRLLLNGTVTDGSVQCRSAADATCDHAASGQTLGCASAPPSCEPIKGALDEATDYTPPEVPWRDD